MSRQPAAEPGANVALLGAATLEGSRVREALERVRVPGSRVNLYGESTGEVVLGDYAGEARIVQVPDMEEIVGHDVVFVCERSPTVDGLADRPRDGRFVVDLVDALPERVGATLVDPRAPDSAVAGGFLSIPHPVALLLSEILRPIDAGPGIEEAVAVVVRPAADFGDAAVQELREQTVRLLNFVELPTDTFGRQLAFNLVPETGLACGVPDAERRVCDQVGRLLGWSRNRLTARFAAASLFFGHALELRVKLADGATGEELERALESAGLYQGPVRGPALATPMEVADERVLRVGEVAPDGIGGYWLWAVAGGSATRAAQLAVEVARPRMKP